MTCKRIITSVALLFACLSLFAQGQVTTRKYRLADFTDKLTKVVLSGNEILAGALRQEVVNTWTSSAFEFCTLEQFDQLKTSDQYYFLIPVESLNLEYLTLVKGGAEAKNGIAAMHEVITLPAGVDLTYLGGVVQAIQEFTLAAMESETAAYKMDAWFSSRLSKSIKDKDSYIGRESLSSAVGEKDLRKLEQRQSLHIVSAEEADALYLNYAPDVLVGCVVAPLTPENGDYCYKLVFEADTHRLCYLERHKIGPKKSEGFLMEDLKRVSR